MSSNNRTTSKGGKGAKADKTHKSDKSDSGKGSEKQNRDSTNSKSEDPSIKDKVRQLIEMSQRSEEEVCLALHECDNDVALAINMLLENVGHGEWETRVKKKKNRQTSTSKQEKTEDGTIADEWNENSQQQQQQQQQQSSSGGGGGGGNVGNTDKDKSSRNKNNNNTGPPRLHGRHNDSRGWRGREKQENERNLDDGRNNDFHYRNDRRGGGGNSNNNNRSSGSIRGGLGRGRGGGRAGGSSGGKYIPRNNRNNNNNNNTYKPIDTWDNSTATNINNSQTENWDDFPGTDEWSTEEYTGSLADTKVFTPSVPPNMDVINETTTTTNNIQIDPTTINQHQVLNVNQMNQTLQNLSVAGSTVTVNTTTIPLPSQSPVPTITGTLSAAQTQYLNQLTQQNSDNMKQYGGVGGDTSQVYQNTTPVYNNTTPQQQQQYVGGNTAVNTFVNSNYPTVNSNYTTEQQLSQQQQQQQPQIRPKTTQRARVPPPSKIPASAVEMPGDINSSMVYLDVQFGAMDFMSDNNTFDNVASDNNNKYNITTNTTNNLDNSTTIPTATSNLDLNNTANQTSTTLDTYSTKTNPQQQVQQQQQQQQSSISSALTQNLTNTDSIPQTSEHLTGAYNITSRTTSTSTPSVTPSGLEINKQTDNHTYPPSANYNTYQTKTNTYNASTYNGTQVTSSSYMSNQSNNSYVNSQTGAYNTPSNNTYQNAYSSATSSYQSNTNVASFPSISQANSYPTNNQSYQQNTNQSVYGANTGLTNSSNFGNTATSQYNSYSSASSHKQGKDVSLYDGNSSTVNNTQTTTTSNVTSSSTALSLSQSTISGTKSTTTLAVKNSNSVVSNIPPGVAPVMSTPYIMGQVPYFQQPVYTYEDVQMLQQRIPHMTTPYYDMSYQTPTTLAAVRDASLGNVGYSISSDGRFTRGDNNASPVPSTLSQQTSTLTQGHQAQPILAGTAAPPYFFTAFNTLAPNYQFSPMYTQLPTVTNAHGSSNSNQYPKPAAYGSGYGSYDTLSQTQDYNKSGYVSNNQGQKGGGVNATSTGSSGNDLSAMYGKSHAALGKVNSYEKQGFHSGTPPPFTSALHGGQNAGLAPSGTGYGPQVYIPTIPHQQQLSTQIMHQQLHQMDVRHQGRRVDSGNSTGQRSQASNQGKAGTKQPYQASYWNQA